MAGPGPTRPTRGLSRVRGWWSAGLGAVGSLVFPWECPVCGGEAVAAFCPGCRTELLEGAGDACPRCARPVGPWGVSPKGCGGCLGRPLGFDAAFALGPYQGPIRALCLSLKHEANGWVAPWLAGLVVDARPGLRDEAAGTPGAWVVPVPLHWSRRLARGYNQADELARGLAARLGLRKARVLRRVVRTGILAGLGRAERARALRHAFAAKDVATLKGRTVFLVDDVLTTGATCGAAARALKLAGAARVVAVVVGRTEGRG